MLYDITRTLSASTAVFPGDTPVKTAEVMRMRDGDSANVSAIQMSVHAGTHIDAPKHYSDTGIGIDQVSLDVLMGPTRVITLEMPGRITKADLEARHLRGVTRLLVHTRGSEIPNDVFDPTFPHFEGVAADYLGGLGIKLIGIDTPSVDEASSKTLQAHMAFLRHNTLIMENLCLTGVPDGLYDLIALPIKIEGSDAAPARVLLRTMA